MTDSQAREAVRPGSSFDFDAFVARCNKLGCITDEQRADLAGVSVRTYYRWQRGKNPTLETLAQVAGNLAVTIAHLTGGAQ